MFIYKTTAELEAMSAQELDAYKKLEKAHEKAEADKAVKEAVEKATEPLINGLKEVKEEIMSVKEQTTPIQNEVEKTTLELLKEKAEELKALKENKSGSIQIKAAGSMTVAGNTTGRVVPVDLERGITRIVRRKPFLESYSASGTTTSNLYEFVEQKNPDGGAGNTAEGTAKTQADFDLVAASLPVKKITSYIKVSKEMLDDIDGMASEINTELVELLQLRKDDQILNGDNTALNLRGILNTATAWAAGGFALGIVKPTEADVLRTAIDQIMVANFMPTEIFMHPTDVTKMDLAKDTSGQYVFRPLANSYGLSVGQIPVVANTGIAVGTFLVGDMTKNKVITREGITLSIGYENDDFTKNFVTILGETRLVNVMKSNHYLAFVKGTFSTAITALTKP